MSSDNQTEGPPKAKKKTPKGGYKKPPAVRASADSRFQSAADEWVQTQISIPKLSKKWGVSRATLFRWKKRQDWDRRKKDFLALVEKKGASLDSSEAGSDTENDETVREAEADEAAAELKAAAESRIRGVIYVLAEELEKLTEGDTLEDLARPYDLETVVKLTRQVAGAYIEVLGPPAPPPQPLIIWETRIEPREGVISTIERGVDESLEEALGRIDTEARKQKLQIISAHMTVEETVEPEAMN